MLALKTMTKAKVINVTPLSMKMGAKDTIAALAFRLEFTLSNRELEQLDPMLRMFLFQKASTAPDAVKARQQHIEGVEPVSDLPSLRVAAQRLGTFDWNEEQTGCTLTFDRAASKPVSLDGCTTKKLQLTANEGGSIKGRVTVNTSSTEELDDATHGWLTKLKKREVQITLEGPKLDNTQAEIADAQARTATVTPIKPLGTAAGAGEKAPGDEEEAADSKTPVGALAAAVGKGTGARAAAAGAA